MNWGCSRGRPHLRAKNNTDGKWRAHLKENTRSGFPFEYFVDLSPFVNFIGCSTQCSVCIGVKKIIWVFSQKIT